MAKQFTFASKECKQLSLRCKAEGLVWHDRYKMILDCRRTGLVVTRQTVVDNT